MPRPRKCRRLESEPSAAYFKPRGVPMHGLEEIIIGFDEFEAVRLKDLNGLDQEAAAIRMDVSRPTYQRILLSARRKIADALINGKALKVQGGSYRVERHGGRRCGCDRHHD